DIAEAVALGWERHRAFIEEAMTPVRAWMVRELDAGPGDTVLELAAGAGDTGYEAATLIGDGHLITSDFSETMLDVARRRGKEVGAANVDYRVIDGENIDLESDSVDRVLCRFGYMLMPDPNAAFSETYRVLRPGGRVAFAVWGAPEHNPYFTLMMMTLVGLGHMPPPEPTTPSPTRLGDETHVRELLAGAGFTDVVVEAVRVTFPYAAFDDFVTMTEDIAGPIALVLRDLSGQQRQEFMAQLEEACAPLKVGPGYEFPGVALCVRAS
ncbi:MAG: class I SAM-dependent methyltransferase, partial [Acidimicrobiia bacterium]